MFAEFSTKLEEIGAKAVEISLVFVLRALTRTWNMLGRYRDGPAAKVRHAEDPVVDPVRDEAPVALVEVRGSGNGPRMKGKIDAHVVAAKLQVGAHGCSARGESKKVTLICRARGPGPVSPCENGMLEA